MSEVAPEPVPEKGNKLKQQILKKVAGLREDANVSNVIAGAGTLVEGLGATFVAHGIVGQVIANDLARVIGEKTYFIAPYYIADYVLGAAIILGGEVARRTFEEAKQRQSGIANHLEAQIILDTLKEKKK